jgi:MoxR-like ATPase
MVATMNPSGDFGKKELSPALRNRMTEIWVESYFEQTELHDLLREVKLSPTQPISKEVSDSIDLYLIVKELCSDMLGHMIQDANTLSIILPRSIFNIICYVSFGAVTEQDHAVRTN